MPSTSNSPFASLPVRVAVAAVAIPVIVFLTMMGGYYFFAFILLISTLSLYEFYSLAESKGVSPLKALGLFFGAVTTSSFIYERWQIEVYAWFEGMGVRLSMFSQLQFLLVTLLIFLLLALLMELFRDKGSPFTNLGVTVLGVLMIPLFFGTLVGLREVFPYGFPVYRFFPSTIADEHQLQIIHRWGGYTVVSLLATIWICDTAAYFGGVTMGKHKLFERVSPKKTWEGFLFGLLFAVLTMIAARALVVDYLSLVDAVVIGILVGVFGQLGDLIESRFKRDVGVKDSSSIIPGHGGVYDRFDSLVFVSPIVYLYMDFVVLS
ncbi:MAG TPA: phosphatidate cytidylyltransferase [Bacteroidota bacterium]|nr:phosphatidate cytidylyltransferase [Bacteroidota bacterium]